MKRIPVYWMAIVLALAVLPAFATAATVESPVILGGKGDESCFDILPLSNGNIVLSLTSTGGLDGGPEYGGNIRKVWLLCLAPDGSTVWENNFGEDREGGYTTLLNLILNGDDTFTGTVRYTLSQYTQFRQTMTFSCADGSVISKGEKVMDTMENDHIYRNYYTNNGYTLITESHGSETADTLHILRMLDADGSELWTLDADTAGISHTQGWIPTEYGAVLYGKNFAQSGPLAQAAAVLVGPDGRVVWARHAADVFDGAFFDAIIDSGGRFIGLGFARGAMTGSTNEYSLGYDAFSQLVVCWDAATGNEIWQKATEAVDRKLPYSRLAEIGGQYILCDSDIDYNGCVYETLDQNSEELQYWTASFPGCTHLSPKFFTWDGELWTENSIEDSDKDIVLERVVIPAGL